MPQQLSRVVVIVACLASLYCASRQAQQYGNQSTQTGGDQAGIPGQTPVAQVLVLECPPEISHEASRSARRITNEIPKVIGDIPTRLKPTFAEAGYSLSYERGRCSTIKAEGHDFVVSYRNMLWQTSESEAALALLLDVWFPSCKEKLTFRGDLFFNALSAKSEELGKRYLVFEKKQLDEAISAIKHSLVCKASGEAAAVMKALRQGAIDKAVIPFHGASDLGLESARFSDDGRLLAVAAKSSPLRDNPSSEGLLEVWDVSTGQSIARFAVKGQPGEILAVNAGRVAVKQYDQEVSSYDLGGKRIESKEQFAPDTKETEDECNYLRVTPAQYAACMECQDKLPRCVLTVSRPAAGKSSVLLKKEFKLDHYRTANAWVYVAPDASLIAVNTENGCDLYRVADGKLLTNIGLGSVAFSPDSSLLVFRSEAPHLVAYSVKRILSHPGK